MNRGFVAGIAIGAGVAAAWPAASADLIGEGTPVSIGLAAMFVVGVFGLWWRVSSAIAEVERDLAAFKLEASRTFATATALEKSENRLADVLNQVATATRP